MKHKQRIRKITYPQIESDVVFDAMLEQRTKLRDEIISEIAAIANNNEDEIARIKQACSHPFYAD